MDSSADVQIWNNAAFDNGEISGDWTMGTQSWGSLKSVFGNAKGSFDSVSGKENKGFALDSKISSVSSLKPSSSPFKPLDVDESVEKSRIEEVVKKGFEEIVVLKSGNVKEIRDGKKIDEEIEEIESQIERLNSRLEALRLVKADRSVKVVEKRAKAVPAKFVGPNQNVKIAEDNATSMSARTKVNRRGISLGPAEIVSAGRRGMSLGPSEIFSAVKSRQSGKQNLITPVQSRRKSCMLKLQDIEEERIKSCYSLSPKSRTTAGKAEATSRQAVTTITSRKTLKQDVIANSVQPKKLFRDSERSVPAANNKPLRPGRVVASRYNNQNGPQASALRKKSLPDNDGDNSKRVEKKRSLSAGKTRADETGSRVKKRWEIPSEIVVHGSVEGEISPQAVVVVPALLPRIRTAHCSHSPRDSGPAKRVAELVGRKSFFADDEAVEEESVCQELTYAEVGDEEC